MVAVGSQTRAVFDMKKVRIVPTVIRVEYLDVSFIMKMKIFKKMRVIFYTTAKKTISHLPCTRSYKNSTLQQIFPGRRAIISGSRHNGDNTIHSVSGSVTSISTGKFTGHRPDTCSAKKPQIKSIEKKEN